MIILSWLPTLILLVLFILSLSRPWSYREDDRIKCEHCRHCQPIPEDLQHFFMPTERHCDYGRGYDVPFDDEIHGTISAVQVTDYCSKFSQRR